MAISAGDRELMLKYALQNAVLYGGRANAGAVMGKVMADRPGLRKDAALLGRELAGAVAGVNRMRPGEQRRRLESIDASLLERKEKPQEKLPPLDGAAEGKVVTRFAPAPSGPLHLMHLLRALGLSYEYARKYRGRFILRFEDTDPRKAVKDAYEWIRDDLKSLGMECDEVLSESDDMNEYYKTAEGLLKEGALYVCSCSAETFKELKARMVECPCRKLGAKEKESRWKGMLEGRDGLVVRLRTAMDDPNPALRDPAMLRVSNEKHALKGTKYHAWPLYNFANVIEDHAQGITHVFRGKEHEHNTAVQEKLYAALGWKPPITVNFGMLRLEEGKLHKRDMREMLADGRLTGWDDPGLPTIRALLRRGYRPEALRQAVFACGLSKNDITVNVESISAENRKLIDAKADRYMAVFNPVKIAVAGLENKETRIYLHPDFHERGKRSVPVNSKALYVSKDDFDAFKGREVRLKNLCNIGLAKNAKLTGTEPRQELQKLHWVSEPHLKVTLRRPDRTEEGLGEPGMQALKTGDIIQMERVGFGRVDLVEKGSVTVFFAHK